MTKKKITKNDLFGNLDFKSLKSNPDFKEYSVREVIIFDSVKQEVEQLILGE